MNNIDYENLFQKLHDRMVIASNETEVRALFCDEISSSLGVVFRLERGGSDARLNHVILEFKDKGLFHGRTNSAKFLEAYHQLVDQYIPQQAQLDRRAMHEYIGIAIDGIDYAFVFYEENGQHRHTALIPIKIEGLHPLLEAVIADVRKPFTIENLLEDFGASTPIASKIISELWKQLSNCLHVEDEEQKVRMLFQEWKKLFGQTSNMGRVGQERIDEYLISVGFTRPLEYSEALFTLHTYNALLFKLISAEVVSTIRYTEFSGFSSQAGGSSLSDFHKLLVTRIEHAEVFLSNNIENFIEGTFFSWYAENAPNTLLSAIQELVIHLGLYIIPTSAHDEIRDIVKAIYQGLVPDALRKNIGEFYTPEWLVDFVLDEIGYAGKEILSKKILDPCCGSGNFLIHAISRYKNVARREGDLDNLGKNILRHVIGFDLNPLAVLAARLNYLLAIIDVLPSNIRIEIPVYLADAVYAPIKDEGQPLHVRSYQIGTVLGTIDLSLPEDLVQKRDILSIVLSLVERDIQVSNSGATYLAHLQQDPQISPILERHPEWLELLVIMYRKVLDMELRSWDRIWCRIIRNYFASVAIGSVDFIAGNPPWVRWSDLPEDYRERIKPTCDRYQIFSSTPFFGGNELDISGMIAYTVTDKWLANNGKLGFVITQIHFQAASSEGFRAFRLPDGTPLKVNRVHDFSEVKPFPQLANKPAVFTWTRGKETNYPVEYRKWVKTGQTSLREDAKLEEISALITSIDMEANPIPPDGRWSILSPQSTSLIAKLQGGSSEWRGRKGITTDLNGIYFVEIIGSGTSPDLVRIRTQPESGHKPIPLLEYEIEANHIFPLLKGAGQIRPFSFRPINLAAIIPNTSISSIQSEADFRRTSPSTFRYFYRINRERDTNGTPLLESRSTWRTRMQMTNAPFYAIYNIGAYTFAPYKVVWAEMAGSIYAAVVSSQELPYGLGRKVIIPDHKIYFASTYNEDSAHYLCSMINSEPIRTFIDSFTVKLQVGTLFRHLNIPPFDAENINHRELSRLSKHAHLNGISPDIQAEIDFHSWRILETM